MPMNVKGMLLHGLSSEEAMRNLLQSLSCDDLIKNFIDHGYDVHLMTKMTPQDLVAVGCKSPVLRKKLLGEIRKLNLNYDLPEYKPMILEQWLDSLKLKSYYTLLLSEGYDTVEKVCQLTWEDLEEIGIIKLGHQKKLLLAIEKVNKSMKMQEERKNESAIYDVHPNHRVCLNGANTMGRTRSGLFQTRTGANLDHRGLPIATVTPALKHISSPLVNSDNSVQSSEMIWITNSNEKNRGTNPPEALKMDEFATTLKRNPPPLPPVRTNSLKLPQPTDRQPIYDNSNLVGSECSNNELIYGTNSSFLTNNNTIVTSGANQQRNFRPSMTRNTIMPIREAPLPPHLQSRLSVPEKIDEEPSNYTHQGGLCISSDHIGGSDPSKEDEFPPPPP